MFGAEGRHKRQLGKRLSGHLHMYGVVCTGEGIALNGMNLASYAASECDLWYSC